MFPYLSVLSIQGLSDLSTLGCYVTVNGRLFDVLTPLDHCEATEPVAVYSTGTLALIIRAMGQSAVATVKVQLEAIPVDQEVWLPLSCHPEELKTIPHFVNSPKVAVTLGQTYKSRLRVCPYVGDTFSSSHKYRLQTYLVKDLAKEVTALRSQLLSLHSLQSTWKHTLKAARQSAASVLTQTKHRETALLETLALLQREIQILKQTCLELEADKEQLENKLLTSEAEIERLKAQCALFQRDEKRENWVKYAVQDYFKGQKPLLTFQDSEWLWEQEKVEVRFEEGVLTVSDQEGQYPLSDFVRRKASLKTPAFPVVRTLLSPIENHDKTGNESPNSTFHSELSDIIQAINEASPDIPAPRLKSLSPIRSKLS